MKTKTATYRQNRSALSLLETIAVVGLISLILLLTLGLIPSFKMSNRKANMELQAGQIAQSKLEELKTEPFDSLNSQAATDVSQDGVGYQMEISVTPGLSNNSKTARVIVRWAWKEQNFEVFRETLICDIPRG